MAETLAAVEQRIRDTVDRQLKPIRDELAVQHKTLYGNGEPGWDEILRTLYTDYKERKESEKETKKDVREELQKYLYFGVTLIIGGTIGGIIDVFINQRFGH